jgi:hypothetical protein
MFKPDAIISWDIDEVSKALKIPPMDVSAYFTDGRRISFILERRIAREVMQGKIATSEGSDYDIIDKDGQKWEVRSITRSGIYFCPSYMVGSGRSFNEDGFLIKLKEIAGYIVTDIDEFPNVPIKKVSKDQVLQWWKNGELGPTTKISHARMLELLSKI